MQKKKAIGFTLIELLTVIAIIGVLAAILVPIISGIRQKANSTASATNLRQIGAAFSLYTQNNRGELPAVYSEADSQVWFLALTPYLQNETGDASKLTDVYRCPSYAQLPSVTEMIENNPTDWRQLGYGMSYTMVGSPFTGWPWTGNGTDYVAPLNKIENPAKTIIVAETDSWSWGIHAANFTSSFLANHQTPERALRHGSHANYLFVDGHVQSLAPEEVEPYLAGNR